ncbi:MAG: hypothetical protein ACRDQY_01715 [Pseudonocardiaceae bacterium]
MSRPPRWGVSSLDYHTHAVDAEHTDAVYVARCGQMLFRGASLYDEPPPGGSMCPTCLTCTERGTPARGPSRPRRARRWAARGAGRGPQWTTSRTCCCPRATILRVCSRPGAAP